MQNCVLLDKKDIRKFAISKRNEMANLGVIKNISSLIVDKILKSKDYINSKNIAIYLSIKNEIDISKLLLDKSKNFYLPRCCGEDLEFSGFEGFKSLRQNKWGIFEPVGEKIDPSILDLIFVPALAANPDGYRIGYGKGFYDKFFAKYMLKAKKIVVVPSSLILNFDCHEKTDIICDYLLSD